MMKLNTALTLLYQISAHLVEQQNEVDGERHKQSQEPQVVEVSGQIILETQVCLVPLVTEIQLLEHLESEGAKTSKY